MLGILAIGLAFLLAVDAIEPDTFSFVDVQDFDGVAVENGDDRARKLSISQIGRNQGDYKAQDKSV